MKQHIFLIGAKSIGAYGGYETFVKKLTEFHRDKENIIYHVAVKKNGQGSGIPDGAVNTEDGFIYNNAKCFEIKIPEFLGPAQAIYYDCIALKRAIQIIRKDNISNPIIYIMTCRIGPFFNFYSKKIKKLGGKIFLNPDGHEWMRQKWSFWVRKYWKYSEKVMVKGSDLIVCDSLNIENYIKKTYSISNTTFIAYGADISKSNCGDEIFTNWLQEKSLKIGEYYLVVGRFVPENNYEIMIKEFMKSKTKKDFALITNVDKSFLNLLEKKLHFSKDKRIKFVGTVYNNELLKRIREEAFAYLHGHEVGGTNPSLLEALSSTKLNLLLNVCFNEEVAKDSSLYWTKENGNLSKLIDNCENIERDYYYQKSKARIMDFYTWGYIADKYEKIWKS